MIVTLAQPQSAGLGELAFGVPSAFVSRAAQAITSSTEGKAAKLYAQLNTSAAPASSAPTRAAGSFDNKALLLGLGLGAGLLFVLNAGGAR